MGVAPRTHVVLCSACELAHSMVVFTYYLDLSFLMNIFITYIF